ncbi:MAG: hypothetical protein GEV03_15730 [Streptosporangiales bacterium]|nr:hypothetical protein [Streptosporangiales bacterium]
MSLKEDEDLQARVQSMLEHCELVNVRVIEFSARRLTPGEAVAANVSSETSYFVDAAAFANRYLWRVEFVDEEQASVAKLTATLLVEYDVSEGFVPDQEAAEAISQSTGYFAAYPYVRELFQSHTARLQLNPLVLGMLMRDRTHPRTITTP